MAKKVKELLTWLGIQEEEDLQNEEEETEVEEVEETESRSFSNPLASRRARVSSVPSTTTSKVVVIRFQNYDNAKDAADHLKDRRPIIANLEKLDNETTRRVVDFLFGAVYGVDGKIQNVSNRIFLITPHNVEVLGYHQDDMNDFAI